MDLDQPTSLGNEQPEITKQPRPRFLTVEQVAEELNVGQPLVRGLLKTGELRGMQIGARRLWRVAASDVESFINHAYGLTAKRVAAGDLVDDDVESN